MLRQPRRRIGTCHVTRYVGEGRQSWTGLPSRNGSILGKESKHSHAQRLLKARGMIPLLYRVEKSSLARPLKWIKWAIGEVMRYSTETCACATERLLFCTSKSWNFAGAMYGSHTKDTDEWKSFEFRAYFQSR
jgi:hypothetical protein